MHDHHHSNVSAVKPVTLDKTQASCPVTGDAIDTAEAEKLGHFRDVDGKRIYFCCSTCVQLFDKDPEQYTDHHLGHEHHHHTSTTGTLHLKEKEH